MVPSTYFPGDPRMEQKLEHFSGAHGTFTGRRFLAVYTSGPRSQYIAVTSFHPPVFRRARSWLD